MNMLTLLRRRESGFGLVELLVGMTIGLVLLGSVGYVFIGSRGAFRTTDNLSRLQENARYAMETMSRDIRMAGYVGCGNLASMTVNTIANPPVPALTVDNALIGFNNGSGWTNPSGITRASGDVLTIMGAFSNGVNLTGNLAPSNANIQISGNPDGFSQNDVSVVTDCVNADIFRVTNVPGNSGIVSMAHANNMNTGNRVGTYGPEAFVMRMDQYTYFIGVNPAGNRALYRINLAGAAEELVEHVHDMQIEYGLDTSAVPDGIVDSYSRTPTTWRQVVTARVNLLLRSPDNNIATATQTLTNFDGASFTATDRRVYQVFAATVGVRNRMAAF